MSANEIPTMTARTDLVQVFFTNGAGTVYGLGMEMGDGRLVMPRRDRAMALVMLELALENVRRSETL